MAGGRSDPVARAEYGRAYYLANRAKILARAREQYLNDKAQDPDALRARQAKRREANRTELNGYARDWRKKHPGYYDNHTIRGHGLTLAGYNALIVKQGNACAICLTTTLPVKGRWYVDHDHATKKVRGLLCQHCNSMLGFGRDDAARLDAGAAYLRRGGVAP